FFFSCRRRHTRFSRDWSSDVCSSDLTFDKEPHPYILGRGFTPDTIREFEMAYAPSGEFAGRIVLPIRNEEGVLVGISGRLATDRSEERRVGKECRWRWSPHHAATNSH